MAAGSPNVDIEPIGEAPFQADVTFNLLPNLGIAAGSRSPAHYCATRELAGRGPGYRRDQHLAQRGRKRHAVRQGADRRRRQCQRVVIRCSLDQHVAFGGKLVTLALSRPAMAMLVPNYSSAFGRPISADNPALRLLTRYLDFVLAGDETEKREIAHRVSTHIFDLAALALGARGDSADIARLRGARAARLEALRSDILGSPRPL